MADSVLPAPDSPEMRIACRCSSIIMLENACADRQTPPSAIAGCKSGPVVVPPNISGPAAHCMECTQKARSCHLLSDGVHVWRQLAKDLASVLRTHAATVQVTKPLVGVHLPSQHSASLHMARPTAASASVSRRYRPSHDFRRPREARELLAVAGGCCGTKRHHSSMSRQPDMLPR